MSRTFAHASNFTSRTFTHGEQFSEYLILCRRCLMHFGGAAQQRVWNLARSHAAQKEMNVGRQVAGIPTTVEAMLCRKRGTVHDIGNQ
jgi:hypothetical protein